MPGLFHLCVGQDEILRATRQVAPRRVSNPLHTSKLTHHNKL